MSILDLYFYVWSKSRYVNDRGCVSDGIIGFAFPAIFALYAINKVFITLFYYQIYHSFFTYVIILCIILILIYAYYRHNGRGEKVIDYYEKSKYNKWYNLLPLHIAFVVSYVSIFLLIIELLEQSRPLKLQTKWHWLSPLTCWFRTG